VEFVVISGGEVSKVVMGSTEDQRKALEITASGAPVTSERPVNINLTFQQPYLPRALKAVDNEHPYGTIGYPDPDRNLSVLQQHVDFFDRNKDGFIYPWETVTGLRILGFSLFPAAIFSAIVHSGLSYATVDGWLPSPFFTINVKNIHKGKHGSDSATFDSEGRFVPANFEEIFSKYSKTSPSRLNYNELYAMTDAMRNANDLFGWIANKVEWYLVYTICKDEAGFVSKEDVRRVYDGSLFFNREKEINARKARRSENSQNSPELSAM
jgi:peroxygenase